MNRLQEARLRNQLARQRQAAASLPVPPEQLRTISSGDATERAAASVEETMAELRRIASQVEALHKQSTAGDPALRALLVEVAAQTSVIAELVSDLGRQQSRAPAAPITGLEVTARDTNDRIQSIAITRGHH